MSRGKRLFCDTTVDRGESCYCQQSLIITSFHASLGLEGVFDRASVFGFLTLTGRATSLASPLDMTPRIHLSSGSTKRIQSEPGRGFQKTHCAPSLKHRHFSTFLCYFFFFLTVLSAGITTPLTAIFLSSLSTIIIPSWFTISCLSILNLKAQRMTVL